MNPRLLLLGLLLPACAPVGQAATAPPPQATTAPPPQTGTAPVPPWPVPTAIPEGPRGDLIRRGRDIATRTYEELPDRVAAQIHCTSCHLDGGTSPGAAPWVGVTHRYPQYRAREGRQVGLEERINGCFRRSMNGTALAEDSPEMVALVAYMGWLSEGVPKDAKLEHLGITLLPDSPDPGSADRGQALYRQKCSACHGPDGEGRHGANGEYAYPPLWGERSFNLGAGLAQQRKLAGFLFQKMPLGQAGTLSPQDARDLAAWIGTRPRPDFPAGAKDYPKGGAPKDLPYRLDPAAR